MIALFVNESPLLGLSNTRAALQVFQLKESLPRCATKLIWLASDWNLSDALTKKKRECRESLEFFLKSRVWMLRFDPQFTRSARKERQIKGNPQKQLSTEVDGVLNSQEFWGHTILQFPSYIWVQYIRCHIMLRGPLQPDLWLVEKAESCLMCVCVWARVRWWLGLGTIQRRLGSHVPCPWTGQGHTHLFTSLREVYLLV